MDKLRGLVHRLCARDPHQLYQRLESQGTEFVMELRVSLLQILVSPDKGVPECDGDGGFLAGVFFPRCGWVLRSNGRRYPCFLLMRLCCGYFSDWLSFDCNKRIAA